MAALEERQQYGLSSRNEGDKTIIHLKLTDSALKTLEEYARNKDVHRKANIKFQNNSGSIQIPSLRGENRTFQFSLSSIQGDLNGSFDCLEQSTSRFGSHVTSLGCMTQRIVVQASDDVYKTTKERMTLAEEESKKVCTKEIKPTGSFMRHIYKKVHKNSNAMSLNKTPSAISQSWSGHGSHHLSHHSGVSGNSGSHSNSVGNGYSSQSRLPSLHSSSSPHTGTGFSHSGSSIKRNAHKSAIVDEPYRDRIIHLLALRPYNKAELLLRLKKDGILDKDKECLASILDDVASQYKDNKYTLAKHVLSEVRLEWPYYSDGERQLVRRRIATDGRSASNSPEESSPHHNNSLPTSCSPYGANNLQKRMPDSSAVDGNFHPPKKLRVSPPMLGDKQMNGTVKKPSAKIENHSASNNVANNILTNGLNKTADQNQTHQNSRSNYSDHQAVVSSKNEEIPSPSSSPDNDTSNYLNKYSVICRDSQRQEYKNDFNVDYFEYQQLYIAINKVSQKFLDWNSQMKKVSKGSPDYEKLERKIFKEYELTKNNTKFMETKIRFEFLHRKLRHIKKLVSDYDQKQMAMMRS
ncbi:RNA polymerase II elongation factor ELL2 [Octopus sinensis]|uniref:RNA polymerase II elongation factor ELL2 n=1 Tax=Octopus sinensis TaxID=2607531 RepID=A0A6P7UA78_9MOLL|nr:RNA polymerase II elongation factor ELL2 [Octopus sinensis]